MAAGAGPGVPTRSNYNPAGSRMLLAGDVGGTKTLLGLFERAHPRPIIRAFQSYSTSSFASFLDMVRRFTRDTPHGREVEAVAFGVAGPVSGNRATLTNVAID